MSSSTRAIGGTPRRFSLWSGAEDSRQKSFWIPHQRLDSPDRVEAAPGQRADCYGRDATMRLRAWPGYYRRGGSVLTPGRRLRDAPLSEALVEIKWQLNEVGQPGFLS